MAALLLALSLLPAVLALWPVPASLDTGTTALLIGAAFYFDVAVENAPADLHAAVAQAEYYLHNDKLGRLVVGRGANDSAALTNAPSLPSLTLALTSGAPCDSIASESIKPLGTRSEEYVLTIPDDGSAATLTANSTLGLFRGLTTFGQLWYYYAGQTYTLGAPIAITDAPAYVRVVFFLGASGGAFALTRYSVYSPTVDSRSILPGTCAYSSPLLGRRVISPVQLSTRGLVEDTRHHELGQNQHLPLAHHRQSEFPPRGCSAPRARRQRRLLRRRDLQRERRPVHRSLCCCGPSLFLFTFDLFAHISRVARH